ncbi:MAG: ribonuclease III [Patescibacteria group bacterium]|nr:ribonuclease III [Patescibacteria group bacterium]
MKDISELAEKLELTSFNNLELLEQSMVHRSYINEHEFKLGHNERLEFLGDAVLELVVSKDLYEKFPDKPEGQLTSIRAALVRKETLGEVADELQLHEYLKLSRGEAKSASNQMAILSNSVEALIGSIYLDQDLEVAQNFIEKYILSKTKRVLESGEHIDAKSQFQELAQKKDRSTPSYKVMSESGPDHNKIFEVAALINDKEIARGSGNSKQAAEMAAATAALEKYDK